MTTPRPLTTEKYAPCMECGSVQCAICSRHLTSAVALLKERINDLYHKIGKVEVWCKSNDEVCDMCEEFVLKEIDYCFQIGKEKGGK